MFDKTNYTNAQQLAEKIKKDHATIGSPEDAHDVADAGLELAKWVAAMAPSADDKLCRLALTINDNHSFTITLPNGERAEMLFKYMKSKRTRVVIDAPAGWEVLRDNAIAKEPKDRTTEPTAADRK